MNRLFNRDEIVIDEPKNYIIEVPTNKIKANPYQPRKEFSRSALYDLANSIREYGILQPLTVRPLRGERSYELIAGERRLRAAKIAGLDTVPAVIYHAGDNDSAVIALIENMQRENLNFLEEAEGYYALLIEHGMTQEEIAKKVGKSQSSIANKVRLLKLPPMVKKILSENNLSERHARALLRLPDEQLQLKALRTICEKHCSVKKAENIVDNIIIKYNEELSEKGYLIPVQKNKGITKGNVKFVVRDIKIFINTIKETISLLKKSGVEAKAAQFDRGEYFEFVIRIPKESNGLVLNNSQAKLSATTKLAAMEKQTELEAKSG